MCLKDLNVCEAFRVGATCEDNGDVMCTRERCKVRRSDRKQCDCSGSRRRVVIEQWVHRVMKRYKLNTMIDKEVRHDGREDVVQHRKVRDDRG